MAHFAELDDNNVVLRVIVISNEDLQNDNGVEEEQLGINLCQRLFGGNWIQTSYSGSFRGNFAGQGMLYYPEQDVFAGVRPHPSWVLNSDGIWVSPIGPGDPMEWCEEKQCFYEWRDDLMSWAIYNEETNTWMIREDTQQI